MNHRLQLFDSPETLAASVSSFLIDGYNNGGNLLIAAKPRHRTDILAELRRAGCFVDNASSNQRLVALDAGEILERITRNGAVEERLFRGLASNIVERLVSTGPLFVYGEVVELLAEQEDFIGARRLEEMWNRLGEKFRFSLLCGYSSAHFTGRAARTPLKEICATHSHSSATQDDTLGRWLLATA
jgi:hypothetical protein